MWNNFKTYLLIDVKLTDSSKNFTALKSRFAKIERYFQDKEWSRENFNCLIMELKEKGSKPSTINNVIKIGKHYDRFLKSNCLADYTYFHEIAPQIETLTAQEVKMIAECKYPYLRLVRELNLRDYIVINFLFATACRIGELQNLLWIDVKNSPLPHVTFRNTKTGGDRVIPITENLYSLLQTMPHNGEQVFNSRSGSMFSSTEFNLMIKKRADLCGIRKNIYAHLFRHSRITHLRSVLKFPIADVAVFAGHKDLKSTMRYDHTVIEQLSVLAYASPFENSTTPQTTIGQLGRDFLTSLINPEKQSVTIRFLPDNQIQFDILNLPK